MVHAQVLVADDQPVFREAIRDGTEGLFGEDGWELTCLEATGRGGIARFGLASRTRLPRLLRGLSMTTTIRIEDGLTARAAAARDAASRCGSDTSSHRRHSGGGKWQRHRRWFTTRD
jgi:hypothetical protein